MVKGISQEMTGCGTGALKGLSCGPQYLSRLLEPPAPVVVPLSGIGVTKEGAGVGVGEDMHLLGMMT